MADVDLEVYGAPDLTYDFGRADAVASAANAAANHIEDQTASRISYAATARTDFSGYFSELFNANADIAASDARELVYRLRDVASFMGRLSDAAREENARRKRAREWRDRVEARRSNWLDATWDDIFGEEPPPTAGPIDPPVFQATTLTSSPRQTPAPGSGGGGGGTSSARPENLRSFANGTAELDAGLSAHPGRLSEWTGDFMATCDFGGIDVSPVVAGFRAWLDANANDTAWANTIAQAFEDAGTNGGIGTVSDAALAASLAAAGVSATRQDLVIDPPTAWGGAPTTGFVNDPVNSATGNFLEPENDLPFPAATALLSLTRMYNSLNDGAGVFGVGWSSILDTTLVLGEDDARFVMADGRQIVFGVDGRDWARGTGENYWLNRASAAELAARGLTAPDGLLVTDNAGAWWAFTTGGDWVAAGAGAGNVMTVLRDASGAVTALEHSRNRRIDVDYVDGLVASVTSSDGRRVEYLYDDDRRLTAVTGPAGTRTYRWNDDDLIDQVTAATGVIECTNVYDAQRRVREQTTEFGRHTRFTYLSGRVTEVADADGSNANTWIADRKGRLVGIIDTDGNRQSMAYDPTGNLVSVTDREGRITVHAYDTRGRKTRTVTPDGADITYGYDDHDRVTTVVTADGGVVTYDYPNDLERNPSRVTDPGGGVTELDWENGLLRRVEDPEGVVVRLDYDAHGELTATRNADGAVAKLLRDATGRVTQAITPLGAVTRYVYGDTGALASREDPDGAIWRYEHGPGGQITAIIDPLGARTELEYGPHGRLTRTTDPLGRAIDRSFDAFGNVTAMTLPDGATWGFTHDALSRLREITDPTGGVWTREYDAVGELVRTTDPTGVHTDISREDTTFTVRTAFEETSVRYDSYGRPERIQDAAGNPSLITYDACGRPVELVDADGGLTRIERDLAGRVTTITTPAGRTTRYEYDHCGRPVAAIDGNDARTTLEYDADSRIVARILPTGERAETTYDEVGRVVRLDTPGVGVTRLGYDKAGRLTFAQDARYGIRRFSYDAAGQLVAATNGIGGVTRYAYDDRGRLVSITDPLGSVTTRAYTDLDQVASQTDPLGRVTTAAYDAAGRQIAQTAPDGVTTEWTYDAAGLASGLSVDGRRVTEIRRDPGERSATVVDHTGAETVSHTLRYSRIGRLVERVTGDETTRWEYDADGARTRLVTPTGVTVDYTRDAAGRLTRLDHSRLGAVHYTRDAFGRILEARAGDSLQTWDYADGFPVAHTRTDATGATVTRIERDHTGRILAITDATGTTRYLHDDAAQLVSAVNADGETLWRYDDAGRLVSETTRHGERVSTYDEAGQLVSMTDADGETTFSYDARGRRMREVALDHETTYSWEERGWLRSVTERLSDGEARQTSLHVDALGDLVEVDGIRLLWDTADGMPRALRVGSTDVFRAPGALAGIDGEWVVGGWRDARSAAADEPWAALRAVQSLGGGAVSITPSGDLAIAGLEWMGARAYDPSTRGFLTTDPLEAPIGAVWGTNPYSFAGNDPLHATDPLGLRPVTDAELTAYAEAHQGALATAADWVGDNWDVILAGAVVVVGVGLMFTGVGGPVGAVLIGAASGALISGGTSYISQKTTTGTVDWGKVGTDTLTGAVSGAVGGGVAAGLARAKDVVRIASFADDAGKGVQNLYNLLKDPLNRGIVAGGTSGSTGNLLDYQFSDGDHSLPGYLQAGTSGFLTGAGGSAVSGYLGKGLSDAVAAQFPNFVAATSSGRHAAPFNYGSMLTELGVSHVTGALSGLANSALKPGGPTPTDITSGLLQGLANGADGPVVGRWAP
ncbi:MULTISPECIES: DUF6531 domain-containing protein [Microbacterium]|uniref:DUF6531 domain-containing protein n=1 Tax=Microbacterium TaxID=33882 RepID=UPI00277F9D8C|nr:MULTISPECIES: DUF6531 domain-containing protein [Microbacterium]MDQ1075122.1 RHS repeat-associated protein [Microbacterium sp. SORGH_AS_0969]MDQ1115353.1 RHS repeat-associated protein [Microbacterium testaceum]